MYKELHDQTMFTMQEVLNKTSEFLQILKNLECKTDKKGEQKMNELKPCPFCGADAELTKVYKGVDSYGTILDAFQVTCCQCGIHTERYESNIYISDTGEIIIRENGAKNAIEAWNRRINDD